MVSSPKKQQGPLQAYLDEVRAELERSLFVMQAHPNPAESKPASAKTLVTLQSVSSWSSNSSSETAASGSGGGGAPTAGLHHHRHPQPHNGRGDQEARGYPVHPIVELGPKELIRKVIIHRKNATPMKKKPTNEFCLIESTSNSVRCSFRFKQDGTCNMDALTIPAAANVQRQQASGGDLLEQAILSKLLNSFQQSAERNLILRRKPVPGYSISFLIVQDHLERFGRSPIVSNILDFVGQLDEEISLVKISLNAHLRQVASVLFKPF